MRSIDDRAGRRRMGLRTSAVRYYERTGLLPKPERHSGQRRYDHAVLARLAVIRFAKHVGFKLTDIKRLLEGVRDLPPPSGGASWPLAKRNRWQRSRRVRDPCASSFWKHFITIVPTFEERGRALDDDKVPDTKSRNRSYRERASALRP